MPAIRLWGRRWHFSSDVTALPAGLSGLYHGIWIIILLVGAIATGDWPRHCESHEGVEYAVVFITLFAAFVVNLVMDGALVYHGLQGAPFEESKRRTVVPLLYAATAPLGVAFVMTGYATFVCTHLEPDCWPPEARNGVTNLLQGLVFANWGFYFVAVVGIALTYNLFNEHADFAVNLQSWEQRCQCIATMLCCQRQIMKRPDGKQPPLRNIAELTAGLLSHVDMDPTDMAAALVLTSAAQNRRRRLRVAKALLPVYRALRGSSSGSQRPTDLTTEQSEDEGETEEVGSSSSSLNDVPSDRRLDRLLARERAGQAAAARRLPGLEEGGEEADSIFVLEETPAGPDGSGRPGPPEAQPPSPAGSLPLTEDNVAVLDALSRLSGAGADDDQARAAAGLASEQLLERAGPGGAGPGEGAEVVSQLAEAIIEEISQLGGQEGLPEAAVPQVQKELSLDMDTVEFNPLEPTIWFPSATSQAPEAASDRSGAVPGAAASGAASPFAAVSTHPQRPSEGGLPPGDGEAISGFSSRIAEGATVTAAPAGEQAGGEAVGSVQVAGGAAAGAGAGQRSEVSATRQITLQYPKVITPSEHVDDFRGPLPADALADIYAGRHEKVPAAVLKETSHFMRFSYAVYSLEPRVERPPSLLDVACWKPPSPEDVIFKGLNELEKLEDDASVEVLHLNCSNTVLAHLPYLIALDHAKRAVVLAIRGTISVADLITDSIVYPEPVEAWLPESMRKKIQGPVFAHAGMVAAAKAIFQDMTERGILQELVQEEDTQQYSRQDGGGGTSARGGGADQPPPQQGMERAGSRAGQRRPSQGGWRSSFDGEADRRGAVYRFSGRDDKPSSSPPQAKGAVGGARSAGTATGPATNVQSQEQGGAAGRLWQGTASSALPTGGGGGDIEEGGGGHRGGGGGSGSEEDGQASESPGHRVGNLMRKLIEQDGWELVVQGHSLGAGAAALVSLKLHDIYPGLKCIAYSCPGGLVSKNLAHAMSDWCTTVAVGKDCVPRMSVSNLGRLMDEMVTSLARCRQPKLKVLLVPWWRRRKADFRHLFWDYGEIPPEPLEILQRYHASRTSIGQPLPMFPPGRLIFLRPMKVNNKRNWDAVWISPEDLIAEGLLLSPHMLRDHSCTTAWDALEAAAALAEQKQLERVHGRQRRALPRRWLPRHKPWRPAVPRGRHDHSLMAE